MGKAGKHLLISIDTMNIGLVNLQLPEYVISDELYIYQIIFKSVIVILIQILFIKILATSIYHLFSY
jgi:hypothetical protein